MIILGRDNVHPLQLWYGGVRMSDLSSVTRMVVDVGGMEADSADDATLVTWDTTDLAGEDWVLLRVGALAIPAGLQPIRLWFYSATYPNGLEAENVPPVAVRTGE